METMRLKSSHIAGAKARQDPYLVTITRTNKASCYLQGFGARLPGLASCVTSVNFLNPSVPQQLRL